MSHRNPVVRNLAVHLAAHAGRVLPRGREEWARAMRHETQHLAGDRAALTWALGCVVASYTERLKTMIDGDVRISRWVLALEMLCCFTPLTFLFIETVLNFGRLDGRIATLALTATLIGPLGLLTAFKMVVLNRPSLSRFFAAALSATVAWTAVVVSVHHLSLGKPNADWLQSFVLIAVLPVVGIAHLLYLSRRPVRHVAAT